jgi:hypothetical protein
MHTAQQHDNYKAFKLLHKYSNIKLGIKETALNAHKKEVHVKKT